MENLQQNNITPSSEYIKGFNEGYVIAKYNPEFKTESLFNENLSDRSKGFQLGMMQFDVEKKLERSMSRFTSVDHYPSKDYTKDKDMNKDR